MASTTTTSSRPRAIAPDADAASASGKGGLAARVNLGKVFAPVPSEFLLITSTALMLTGFGLVMILSATSATATARGEAPYEAVIKQGVFALIGIPLMLVASRLPVEFWKRMAWPALIGALLFQMLVFTPLGIDNDGNRNWIKIAVIHMHPEASGAAIGETSLRDFRRLVSNVSRLAGGAYLNCGSAVVLPEVFLKAVSLVRNRGISLDGLVTVNLDFVRLYRPQTNVVHRPTAGIGRGYSLVGHHELLIPLLAASLIEASHEGIRDKG